MELNTILVTQARMSSTRLPGKVLMEIDQKPLLKIHLERLSKCTAVDKIVVATTTNPSDTILAETVTNWGFEVYRGQESDVLDRFYQAVKDFNPEWIIRVTSDCPLIDPKLIDKIIKYVKDSGKDYGSNVLVERFPDGQDVEVFSFAALEQAWKNATLQSEREHVTPYIRNNAIFNGGKLFSSVSYPCDADYSGIRMTVDEKVDYDLVEILINNLGDNKGWMEYTNYIIEHSLGKVNGMIIRNEGLIKSVKND
jgi:spore coat polysaccharide biosynthesis protein SpsF